MFGRAHNQPGILIEPKPNYAIDVEDSNEVAQFRNLVWYACLSKQSTII